MNAFLTLVLETAVLILLIAGSAFFSSAEMSLFSLSRARIESFKGSSSRAERMIYFLMDNYNRTLVTIILSNMFVNSCISMLNDDLIRKTGLTGAAAGILSAFVAIVVLLLFGEITPMTLAYVHCNSWSKVVSIPVCWMRTVLTPVTAVVDRIAGAVLNVMGRGKSIPLSREEYEVYLKSCAGKGAFSNMETEFLKETLEYSAKDVTDVMIPRVTTGFLHKNDPPERVEQEIRSRGQLFIPVGQNTPDDADCILLVLKFFLLPPEKRKDWMNTECVRPAVFLPANSSVMLALRKLRTAGEPAALVSDEYGGIAGLVSQLGILMKLTAAPMINEKTLRFHTRKMGGNRWIFDALTPLDAVRDITGWTPPESYSSNTLNGILFEELNEIPERNSSVMIGSARLRVVSLAEHRASRIEFTLEEQGEKSC